MKITGWTSPDNPKYEDFFEADFSNEELNIAEQLVIEELKTHGYKICGLAHQNSYCPVIDNKYYYMVSMRKWGSIMQKAYNINNADKLAYVLWAWNNHEDPVYPECEQYDNTGN